MDAETPTICGILVVMADTLTTYLKGELEHRGWTQRELGRRASLSKTAISQILGQTAQPTADTVVKLAHALDADPVRLLRLAGILPDVGPAAEEAEHVAYLLDQMPQPDRDYAIRLLMGLAQSTGPLPVSARPTNPTRPPRCPDCVFNENFTQAQRTAALRKMLDLYGEEYIPVFLRFITESLEDQRREEEKRPTERPQPGNDQPGRAEGNGTTTTENSAAPTGAVRSSN
jgi:transcriptional regulator with XRE-family HTH domain